MNNQLKNLQDIFTNSIFRIPDYQRGYSWNQSQLEEFWNDLVTLIGNNSHYTGMLTLKLVTREELDKERHKWNNEEWLINAGHSVYEVIDGQQRLTTAIILINEIVKLAKKLNKDELNNLPLDSVISTYLYRKQKILTTYKFGYMIDNPSYDYFIYKIIGEEEGGEVEESFYTLNLNKAREFFEKRLINYYVKHKYNFAEIEKIYQKLVLQLKFNIYTITNDFNVYVAFETMNNRGKRLSYLEILKNRLIYLTTLFEDKYDNNQIEDVRNNINDTWKEVYKYLGKDSKQSLSDDEFLQAHWIVYFGYHTRKDDGNKSIPFYRYLLNKYFIQQNISSEDLNIVDSSYEDDYYEIEQDIDFIEYEDEEIIENKKINLDLDDIKKYVISLKRLVRYWYYLHFPNSKYSGDILKYLIRLNDLGYVNSKPLVMVLLSKYDQIGEEKIVDCLKKIERFNFLHYRLYTFSSNFSNSVFYNYARDLENGEITVQEITEQLDVIEFSDTINNVINVSDVITKFNRLFKRDGFYSWPTIKYLLYVYDLSLATIPAEQLIPREKYYVSDNKQKFSVEHIYPQTPKDQEWIDNFKDKTDTEKKRLNGSLGNLLPLSTVSNTQLQNKIFSIKKLERYSKGCKSELEVSKYDDWTPKEIVERGMKIVNFMEEEWDFKFKNDAERKQFLGLDFMIEEDDEKNNVTEPILKELNIESDRFSYSEEQYNELIKKTDSELLDMYKQIEDYIINLDSNIKKNTTSIYMSYATDTNFAMVFFNNNKITVALKDGNYNDPDKLVYNIPPSYNWPLKKRIYITQDSNIEYIKNIIKQSYELSRN